MKVENFMHFKSIDVPDGFVEEELTFTADSGRRWTRNFVHTDVNGMVIALYYRGLKLGPDETDIFRKLLLQVPLLLFEERSNFGDEVMVSLLRNVMGNMGDNQITNPPDNSFHLQKLHGQPLNNIPVLDTEGHFRTTEGGINMCHIVQFDGAPTEPLTELHEIMFVAPSVETYMEFHPAFEDFLVSIEWQF